MQSLRLDMVYSCESSEARAGTLRYVSILVIVLAYILNTMSL
jgi:hypothetical protein